MRDNLLIVFARNTDSGIVKSRLADSIGSEKALKIYIELSKGIKRSCSQLISCNVEVHYYPVVQHSDHWDEMPFAKAGQIGDDLGQRMHNAIKNALKRGYQKVCLIGTDIYGLTAEILESAFSALDHDDIVFGPARDGGYYLVGMKRHEETLFHGISWSSDNTLLQSIDRAKAVGLDITQLPDLHDVDRLEDVYHTDLTYLLKP